MSPDPFDPCVRICGNPGRVTAQGHPDLFVCTLSQDRLAKPKTCVSAFAANVSFTALLGRTWAPCGQTPKQKVTGKRGGVSAMSAITSRGRLIFRLHDKRIASQEVMDFLAQMLKHHRRRHLVVVMDQAPPHTSKKTKAFINPQNRLHVFNLPKYSPDWNPDEKVWNHLKHQELKGHQAKTKNELKVLTQKKLTEMSRDLELLQGIFFRCCVADLLE